MRAPNILLVMADQLAPHHMGTYGHPLVRTPHIDALAERGVRFDAAYVHSPLCAPARYSMLSGRAITDIGAYDNASELAAGTPTAMHHLRLAGYRTCLSGKMHFVGPDQLHGFDERLTTDVYPADFAWTPDWTRAGERIDAWYHGMDTLHEAGVAMTTYQIDYDTEVAFAARRKLFDYARDGDPRPWFLVASFIHPHDPYVARPEWWDLYDHDEIELPAPVDVAGLDPHTLRIRAGIQSDTVGHSDEQARNARHGYYANTSFFDHWVGQLVGTLDEIEQRDDTVVIVTSDHGDMLGERGAWFKMSFFERSARVPFVVSGPGVADGAVVAEVCGHLDVLPTLLDIAGADADVELPGRSLWGLAAGDGAGRGDGGEALGEYCGEMTSHPVFMIRRGRHKYIHCDTDPPLLYDVVADPDERANLCDDPDHAELAASFAAETAARWDSASIRDDVIASQEARRIVHAAMTAAAHGVSWDHEPRRDVTNEYVRNHMDWSEVGPRTRFPPLGRAPGRDGPGGAS